MLQIHPPAAAGAPVLGAATRGCWPVALAARSRGRPAAQGVAPAHGPWPAVCAGAAAAAVLCLGQRPVLAVPRSRLHCRAVAAAQVAAAWGSEAPDDGRTLPNATWRCLHEDPAFLVVEKSEGLLTMPGRGPEKADCLLARVHSSYPEASCPHRLDRDTSGIMILARDPNAQKSLAKQFQDKVVRKRYEVLVKGWVEQDSGVVDRPIGKFRKSRRSFGRMVIADDPAVAARVEKPRPSITMWTLLRRHSRPSDTIANACATRWSRLSLVPMTGRSHQLRLHMTVMGHPILGDALHGGDEPECEAPRLFLHASALSFKHPVTGDLVEFESAVPF